MEINVSFRDLGGEVCEDMNVSAAAEKNKSNLEKMGRGATKVNHKNQQPVQK